MTRRFLGAALFAALCLPALPVQGAKPPDLPHEPKIFLAPPAEPCTTQKTIAQALGSALLFSVHPFLALVPVEELCPQAAPAQPSGCPYLRQQAPPCDRHVQLFAGQEISPDVLRNLKDLELAASYLQFGRELAREGHIPEALECMDFVQRLCPGSSFETRAWEVLFEAFRYCEQATGAEEACEEEAGNLWLNEMDWEWTGNKPPPTSSISAGEFVALGVCCTGGFLLDSACRQLTGLPLPVLPVPVLVNVYSSDPNRRILEDLADSEEDLAQIEAEWERIWSDDQPIHLTAQESKPACTAKFTGCGPEALLSLHCAGEPLCVLLDNLRACQGLTIVVDAAAIAARGIHLCQPVTLHVEDVPVHAALRQVLEPLGLTCVCHEGVAIITTAEQASGEDGGMKLVEFPAEQKPACPAPCARAQALHAMHHKAGIHEQVRGLMKACHLALAEGRHDKAADLARQAHALDPQTVEADPVVYKLHLLAEKVLQPSLPPVDDRVPADLDGLLEGQEQAKPAPMDE
jgi:hypothetical protein